MNDNLQELIEKLVYKTTDETGWAPQNKLGQYLARLGRSVRELGYDKMSSFFQDHPERFEVEKDVHGLPVVRLIGDAPNVDLQDLEIEIQQYQHSPRQYNNGYTRQNQYNDYQPRNYGRGNYQNNYQGGYQNSYQDYNNFQPYGRQNGYRQRPMSNPYGNVNDYRRRPEQLSLFRWAFFPDREEWLQMLSDLAKEQVWQYEDHDPNHPNPALFDYLRDTFRRLQLEGKVLESRSEGLALFNTGLVDREEGRPIFAVFGPNPNRNRQPWLFQEFFLSSGPLLAAQRAEEAVAQDTQDDLLDEDDDDYNLPPLPPGENPRYYND